MRSTVVGSIILVGALSAMAACSDPVVPGASARSTATSTTTTIGSPTTAAPAEDPPTMPTTPSTPTSTTMTAPPPEEPPPLTATQVHAHIEAQPAPLGGRWNADTSTYDPAAELSVVVASLWRSTVSSPQQVFFFHRGVPVESSAEPRAGLDLESVAGDTATITYAHYRPTDPSCCPSLPEYRVRFRWDGHAVQALDPMPPADQGTGG